jgi:2-C-methyl-D-erythritol 4-phosphate cytidylyltransferase
MAPTAAIVLAGGSGARIGLPGNKVYELVAGRVVLGYALAAIEASNSIETVVVVVRDDDRPMAEEAIEASTARGVAAIVTGGPTRHASEVAGLQALEDLGATPGLIAIHDAARPFVTADLVDRLVAAASEHGAAVPGYRVSEPMVRVVGGIGHVIGGDLAHVQTPQVFVADLVVAAYRAAGAASFAGVDTAETVARFGHVRARLVPSDVRNFKITYAADLEKAERIVPSWTPHAFVDTV